MIREFHCYVKLKNGLIVQVNILNDEVDHFINQIDRGVSPITDIFEEEDKQ